MVKRLTAIIVYIISVIILPAILTVIIADSNMIMVSAKNDRTQNNKAADTNVEETHIHTIIKKIPANEPTAYRCGNIEYYICACGSIFIDEDANKRAALSSVLIPAYNSNNYSEDTHNNIEYKSTEEKENSTQNVKDIKENVEIITSESNSDISNAELNKDNNSTDNSRENINNINIASNTQSNNEKNTDGTDNVYNNKVYDIESTQTVDYKTQPSTIEDTSEDVQAEIYSIESCENTTTSIEQSDMNVHIAPQTYDSRRTETVQAVISVIISLGVMVMCAMYKNDHLCKKTTTCVRSIEENK